MSKLGLGIMGDGAGDNFRRNLAILMAESELNDSALAAKVGRAVSTVTRWRNADRDPSFEDLQRIADALGTTVPRLFLSPDYTSDDLNVDKALVSIKALIARGKSPIK